MASFVEKVRAGEEDPERIHDYISNWHASKPTEPLHVYLGLTWKEYKKWVEGAQSIEHVIKEG